MTIDELMDGAGQECIDTREAYLVMFTEGVNAYVCRNEATTDESRALFYGTYRECQVWIERRGVMAALQHVIEHIEDVAELAGGELGGAELLEALLRVP